MNYTTKFLNAILIATALSPAITHAADFKWWATSSSKAVAGQITLNTVSGGTRTINSNPTGESITTRTANTQAPTLLISGVPVRTEWTAANVTAGCELAAKNNTPSDCLCDAATEVVAKTSDNLPLSCQSGVWRSL